MSITVRVLNITTIAIAVLFGMSLLVGNVEAAPKNLSKPNITVVKIDNIKNMTKAYNRICMSDMYEADNVQIYRKVNNGKWRKIKTVKHYNGKYIGGRYVVYTDVITKYTKNYTYSYRVKCNGDGWSRSKKYTNYSPTKSSTIGKRSFKIQLKNAATNRIYSTSYVRYGGNYTAPAKGQATTGYTFTGWTTKTLKNIKKGYTITANYKKNNSKRDQIITAPSSIMTINVGEIKNIGATINSNLPLTYTSTNKNIAEVDNNGNVTGKKAGNVKISISHFGNNEYNLASKTITITVVNNTSTTNSFKFTNVPSKIFTRPATENRNDIWDIEFEGSNIRSIQWSLEDYKNGLINSPGGASTVSIYSGRTTSPLKIQADEWTLDNNHNAGKFRVVANITYYDGSTQTERSPMITNTVYKQNSDGSYNWENMSDPDNRESMYEMYHITQIYRLPKNSTLHFDISKMDTDRTELGGIATRFTIDSTFNPLDKNYVLTYKDAYDILVLDGGGYSFNVSVKASSNSDTRFNYTVVLDGRNQTMYDFKSCLLSIQSAVQGKSEMDKVRYILDYMSRNFTQASSEEQITGTGYWAGGPVGLFLKKRGSCTAYSGFFKVACDYCDIECYVRGSRENGRPGNDHVRNGHVNNAVVINNQKYVVESQGFGDIVLWTDWLAKYPNVVWK